MALKNDDFRKLLASTPRREVAETPARSEGKSHSFNHKSKPKFVKPHKPNFNKKDKKDKTAENDDEEEAIRLKEILKNYRDRAAERRDKGGAEESDDFAKLAAAYQAVPGSARESRDKVHSRRRVIEESKFLGGDMEHTHLVKGLDYSLLHKVRSEIDRSQTNDDQEDLDKAYNETKAAELVPTPPTPAESKMVRNMQQILFKNELPLRNDLFKKGRMAYVVEMEEENQSEVPTTLLRSLIDCPNNQSNSNINANNMLISKLTQVLSYLRADHKKKKRPEMTDEEIAKYQEQSIYDNEAEYVPRREKDKEKDKEKERKDDKRRDDDKKKTSSYFDDRDKEKERERDRKDRDRGYDRRDKERERDRDRKRDDYDKRDREKEREREKEKEREQEQEKKEKEQADKEKRLEEKMEKRRKEMESGGYDECYPGGFAELGGSWGDSDDEDFSKMDMGNKKANVKRWDFDNQDEFEKYQGGREALPKAAFQFGVKPQDGRKTRKSEAANNKKLDKELNEIEKINEKRKAAVSSGGDYKKPKY